MVDPDNRRPVDFTKHQALLDELIEKESNDRHDLLRGLLQSWRDGRVKLYLTYKALHTRHAHSAVFLQGRYTPLSATGAKHEHVTAFARHHGETWIVAAVPRLPYRLCAPNVFPLGEAVWETGELVLPHDAPGTWSNVFTGESLEARPTSGGLRLSELFFRFPVALLIGKP
jgi:(1->4)-alpha-D-glucan 1-alpha-D-glucosylmutase